MMIDSLIHCIRDFIRGQNLPIYRVARMSGLNESTIRDLFSENWNPTTETIRKLERILPAHVLKDAIAEKLQPSIPKQEGLSHETSPAQNL